MFAFINMLMGNFHILQNQSLDVPFKIISIHVRLTYRMVIKVKTRVPRDK